MIVISEEDHKNLLKLAGKFIEIALEAGNCDGGEIQEILTDCGLIAPVTMKEPCGEGCQCLEMVSAEDFPIECYQTTELGRKAMTEGGR